MKYRVGYVEKIMRPVKVGGLLTIRPDVYAVTDYRAATAILTVDEIDSFLASGVQVLSIEPLGANDE